MKPRKTNAGTGPTFAALLSASRLDAPGRAQLARLGRQALLPLGVAATLLALWAFTAPLSGAIVATGRLKVELDHKTVQHKEGGIVRGILVRDGDLVRAGQTLIVIDDVRNEAELSLLADQLAAERIRGARALAESTLAASFVAPGDTGGAPRAAEHLARETALFAARRRTLDEQVAALDAQVRDSQLQAAALESQIEATLRSLELAAEEVAINSALAEQGHVPSARLLALRRAESDYAAALAAGRSELALARQRAAELAARSAQARNHYQQVAADEAKEAAARIRELEERLRPFRDQAQRQEIRAPAGGRVLGLRVSSAGAVVGAGEPLLDIVPTEETLVVEARIRPQDIQHVYDGAAADVRLSALDPRTTPLLPGTVALVSADRVTSQDGRESWYVANVLIDPAALAEHPEIELRAGMPAELFIQTPERTLVQYLVKPLRAFASRAMREP